MTNRQLNQSSVAIDEPDRSTLMWLRVLTGALLFAALLALINGGIISMLAFAFASLMCWAKPFHDNRAVGKPTLSQNGRKLAGAVAFITAIAMFPSASITVPITDEPTATSGAPAASGVTYVDYAIATSSPLRTKPDAAAEQVQVAAGSDKTMTPVTIDTSMQVREIRRTGEWSEVRLLMLPSDLGGAQGWVKSATLRPVKRTANGRRVYEAKDFEWFGGSARYKDVFVSVANKVMRENPDCDAINTQSVLLVRDSQGPKLKLLCYGSEEQVVDFRPADATNGRSFAPLVAIDKESARTACETAAKQRASHPSTVDVSVMGGTFKEYAEGEATYQTTFTAKNSFGLELNYDIRCSYKGNEFSNVQIEETTN